MPEFFKSKPVPNGLCKFKKNLCYTEENPYLQSNTLKTYQTEEVSMSNKYKQKYNDSDYYEKK